MKAVVCTGYGSPDVLKVREVPKPIPGEHELLVRILAFPITAPDRRIRGLIAPFDKAQFLIKLFLRIKFGLIRPKLILGSYLAGRIEAFGKEVTRLHVGDEVIAFSGNQRSTYAEYICLPEDAIMVPKPHHMTFEECAAIPYGGCSALYFLKRAGGIEAGQRVLVYGASGAIGSSAVQLAKHFGAEVTGVTSGANLELVRSLGADHVIDYTKKDFTENSIRYDLIFDAVGKASPSKCEKSLNADGTFISVFKGHTLILQEDLVFLKTLVEAGSFRPVIDRVYPLDQIANAHSYADKNHTKGIVVVSSTKEC